MLKTTFLTLVTVMASASFASAHPCKLKATAIAKAVDSVYTPKLSRKTRVTTQLIESNDESSVWVVNFMNPNAGGQTAYSMELSQDSCFIINLTQMME